MITAKIDAIDGGTQDVADLVTRADNLVAVVAEAVRDHNVMVSITVSPYEPDPNTDAGHQPTV